ncbi:MAG TPA: hypothetical protein VGG48_08890 [Rhizomicrobium sp.]
MVRILNFVFVALAGLACFAMNHVAEQTRQADIQLRQVHHEMAGELKTTRLLQAQWQVAADPERIRQLAQQHLGLTDTPTVALSSLELLPRKGDGLNDNPIRSASMVTSTTATSAGGN